MQLQFLLLPWLKLAEDIPAASKTENKMRWLNIDLVNKLWDLVHRERRMPVVPNGRRHMLNPCS
jgi:hypothetical protein